MEQKWQQLQMKLAEITDLLQAANVLNWDQQTYMPPKGGASRAQQLATLQQIIHERVTQGEIGDLLAELENSQTELREQRAALLREARRRYDEMTKLPASLVGDLAKTTALAMEAWVEARQQADFTLFQPHLERIVHLSLQKAQALGFETTAYDALLNQFEPGTRQQHIDALFSALRPELTDLLQHILPRLHTVDDKIVRRPLAQKGQLAFAQTVIKRLGFDETRGRLDLSVHPFTTSFSPSDVRLTTRVHDDDLRPALYAAIHEAGHGMYEQGLPAQFARSILGQVPSLGWHESQSRLWENIVGRSRAFWTYFLPVLQQTFPGTFDTAHVEAMYRAVNRVEPTFIRTEADEVTYNLHIMMRYELETALLQGDLSVADLPGAWDDKMEAYLGIRPRSVTEGVLQDVHWAHGMIGYFPTYTIGTVLAAQLYDLASKDVPGMEQQMSEGNFAPLLQWMQKHIYSQGSLHTPADLAVKVTGGAVDSGPYLRYMQEKYRALYDL